MRNFHFVLLLLLWPISAPALDRYQVRFDDDLATVDVEACFQGNAPARLYHAAGASRFAGALTSNNGSFSLRVNAESTRLPSMAPGTCLNWQVDLLGASSQADSRLAMRVGNDIVTNADLWFWRGSAEREVQVDIKLPEGMSISVPWQPTGQSGQHLVFKPAGTPPAWASRIAVGRFSNHTLKFSGGQIRLALLGGLDDPVQEKLRQWLSQAAQSVSGVYGQFPRASPQVLIIPIGSRGNPVPWAHVMRGGGVSAEFFVDQTRPLDELERDWTACHELSHMLLPFIASQDRWLSEGLASYYQYILLARSGMLSEQQAWQGLFDGIRRGQQATNGRTLADVTPRGRSHTMRIYWSGAAMMLLADIRLRASSENRQSLDTALASLQSCCLEEQTRWRAKELFRQLDRLTGTGIFSSLYEEHVDSESFPDLSAARRLLGINLRDQRVQLDDQTPGAELRISIMKPRMLVLP